MFVCVETWGENFFVPKIKRKVTLCKRRGGGEGEAISGALMAVWLLFKWGIRENQSWGPLL